MRARRASRICRGDIRDSEYGTADAVVLLDVLHYMEYRAQEQVLARVRAALAVGGVLLLRVGDAAGGIRFPSASSSIKSSCSRTNIDGPRFYCRSVRDWQNLLARRWLPERGECR